MTIVDCCLLICFGSLYRIQYEPWSDYSHRSSLIRVHSVYFHSKSMQQNGSWPQNLFPLMIFRLISLYMGIRLLRIYAIIYDHVFSRVPRPANKEKVSWWPDQTLMLPPFIYWNIFHAGSIQCSWNCSLYIWRGNSLEFPNCAWRMCLI